MALAGQGRISAVSCLTTAPSWRTAGLHVQALQRTGVDIGLHLDLTFHPFDAGLRRPLAEWLLRTSLRASGRQRLRTEIVAQLDAFETAVGRPPAHVDGHQHVHQLPVLRDLLTDVLARRYAGHLPWLRSTRRASNEGLNKAWVIERLGAEGLRRLASRRGFHQNGHLLGVYDFGGDTVRYLALLGAWLGQARDGDLLMCHAAADAPHWDPIGDARRRELTALSGDECGALLAQAHVQIAPMREIVIATG